MLQQVGVASQKEEVISRSLSKQAKGLSEPVLSVATALYISLSGPVQKAAVHDGYAISRLS